MTHLVSTLAFVIPALGAVLVAWLNRQKIIEVHTLVNGDRTERTQELSRVNEELVRVNNELDEVKAELAALRTAMK